MLEINLKDKIALVTGVSSGVGKGVAKMMARAGCKVIGCSRAAEDSMEANEFVEMIQVENSTGKFIQCDVTQPRDLKNLVVRAADTFGAIDVLVSNAGINIFEGAEDCIEEKWALNMDLNLAAHWRLSKLCKPWLERANPGVILIMSSNHGNYTIPGCFPYNVSKTALKGLVQSLAIEWGPNIRTVGVAPGFIDTVGNQKWFDSFPDSEQERQRTIHRHPVRRIGTAEEVGQLCAYLASDAAAFISGTMILMDGGRSALMQDAGV